MSIIELFIIAVGLSMDAFAVSICKGLSVSTVRKRHMLKAGAYFGGFQALMPLIGYFIGIWFRDLIVSFDHWIAFILLGFIGINMIRESFTSEEGTSSSFAVMEMILLSLATSIDALAVGVTLAFFDVSIIPAAALIGTTTFIFSFAGIWIGNIFGEKHKSKAEITGGIILILIGTKILIEHLFYS